MNRILALDINSKETGYSVYDGKFIDYGVINQSGNTIERLEHFKTNLAEIIIKNKPEMCLIEDMIGFRNGRVTKLLNYFNGVAILTFFELTFSYNIALIAKSKINKVMGFKMKELKAQGYKPEDIKRLIWTNIQKEFAIKIPENYNISDSMALTYTYLKDWQNVAIFK